MAMTRKQYEAMSLDALQTIMTGGTMNEEEAALCQEVIDKKTPQAGNRSSANEEQGSDRRMGFIFLGFILIACAVGGGVFAETMIQDAAQTMMFKSTSQGKDMIVNATLLKHGSLGVGLLGTALMAAGLVKTD